MIACFLNDKSYDFDIWVTRFRIDSEEKPLIPLFCLVFKYTGILYCVCCIVYQSYAGKYCPIVDNATFLT